MATAKSGKSGKGKGKGSGRKSSSSSSSKNKAKKDGEQSSGIEGVHQSPKNTGPGAKVDGAQRDANVDATHGRFRDEVADTGDPTAESFVVRRTFLASKTEFEVTVPKAGIAGIKPGMPRHQRDKAIIEAAQTALNLRTQQLSTELDNSDIGGKSIAQPVGGGTYNPENKYAPKPSPGEPGAGSDRNATPAAGAPAGAAAGSAAAASSEPAPRKGMEAPTTATGQPITEASLAGTPNDRTATAGTSKSAETVAAASTV